MNLKLTAMLLALACLPGCAQLAETPILMGGKEYLGEADSTATAGASPTTGVAPRPAHAGVDTADVLAQRVLFLPFKDESKFNGPWDIPFELANGLADTLAGHGFLKIVPIDSVMVRLDKKERAGNVTPEKALKFGRELGVDYVILGEIEEFVMKRFQATIPLGGYRSYQGLVTINLKPFKVIDGRATDQVKGYGETDEKRYGVTNPAAYIKLEKEYHLLGDIAWGSDGFRETLLGQATGNCLHDLAANLTEFISPPPELTVSEPKIVLVDDGQVYINVGSENGVQNGDKYGVWDYGEELIDSGSGIYLGKALPRRIGAIQVEQVLNDKLSLARILQGRDKILKDYQIRAE